MGWFDQQAAGAPDLAQMWNAYQAGELTSNDIRSASMDEWDPTEFADTGDTGANHRKWAEGIIARGLARPEDFDQVLEEIDRTNDFKYQPGIQRTFDGTGPTNSYDINDQAKRAEAQRASEMGAALPDSTDLSQAGWQNVTPEMSQQFRDQGFIPQAPPSEAYAQSGNAPPLQAGAPSPQPTPPAQGPPPPQTPWTGPGSPVGQNPANFGAVPEPFGEQYTAQGRPSWLQQPYQAQQWSGGDFQAPAQPESLQTPYTAPTWQGGDFNAPAKPTDLQTPYQAPVWQGGDFQAPTKPGALQQPYAAPVRPGALQQPFTAPTAADMQQDPGYAVRLQAAQKAFERSAAAKGSILSGGSQIALGREQQNIASNEYGNVYNRALTTRQQQEGEYGTAVGQSLATRGQQEGEYQTAYGNAAGEYGQRYGQFQDAASRGLESRNQQQGEYQTAYGNAAQQYQQRYGQFQDSSAQGLQARNQNVGEYQTTLGNAQSQYNQRYGQFQDSQNAGLVARGQNEQAYQNDLGTGLSQYNTRFNAYQQGVTNRRNADSDVWARNRDLADIGLRGAALARP